MKLRLLILVLSVLFVRPAFADIKSEIASIDSAMARAFVVAQTTAARSKANLMGPFLVALSNLERQYANAGDRAAVLACRKARAKYDPSAPKVNVPTTLPKQLIALVVALEKKLSEIDRKLGKDINEAKSERAGKLMALQRGLVRGDRGDFQLVINALKSRPTIPRFDATKVQLQTIIPKDVIYLTYDRSNKRWKQMEGKGVRRTVSRNTTTLHYKEGSHWLLKSLWPDVLEVGDSFSVEVKGAFSVEVVDLEGADANARFNLPEKQSGFAIFEITREKDRITFVYDGKVQKTYYASGKLRGDAAKDALLATPLRAGLTVKKGEKASFRNAKIIRP